MVGKFMHFFDCGTWQQHKTLDKKKTTTVQPKSNARARTSFCVRKQKFFLQLIAGRLSLSSGNRKNFFAVA